jgi:hypothetical protein
MKAHPAKMKAIMEAWFGKMEANQEKLQAKTEAYPEKMETNQEKTEGVAEHVKGTALNAKHVLTAPQDRTPDVLQWDPKGATSEETIGAPEDRFRDQHLALGYRNQLKTRTLEDG